MRLYHAEKKDYLCEFTQITFSQLSANLDSIRKHGINPEFSQGKEAVIWLHTASRKHWAITHVQKKYKVTLDDVVIIEVNVPRGKLKKRKSYLCKLTQIVFFLCWRGLWSTTETTTDFISITDAEALAASPIP